jgi:Type IV secretory system Conjugative DNA transfer
MIGYTVRYMPEPFHPEHREQSDTRFRTPAEELVYLRAQILEKERQLASLGHTPEREAVVHEAITEYQAKPAHEVLHETHAFSEQEVRRIMLDLPPDRDDATMEELLGILHEKGIRNALTVAERLYSPHLEDDFHRVLIRYVAEGNPLQGVPPKEPLWHMLHMSLFEVTLPEPTTDEHERPFKEVVSAMEQFYMGMFSINDTNTGAVGRYYSLEVAVSGEHEDIVFYMAVPTDKEDLFIKQLSSVFPKARAHHVPQDYNIFIHDGATAVGYATLERDAILPLKDYRDFDHDPLVGLVQTFTKIAPVGEGAAVQFVINPTGDLALKRYQKILEKVEQGMKLDEAIKDTPDGVGGEVLKNVRDIMSILGDSKKKQEKKDEQKTTDQALVELLRKKLETPLPGVVIRVSTSAATQTRADMLLTDIVSSFNQYQSTSGNRLKFERCTGKAALGLAKQFTFREYTEKHALRLSVRELTSMLHFPTHALSATPQLRRLRAAEAPAPIGLPQEGTLLGTNRFRGVETHAFLTDADRLRHLYVIGQTGTGKTVFLKNLIAQDIDRGAGVCFIDPHGSDIEDVLANIPEHRFKDVIYFDPANTQTVLGLNMLEYDARFPEQKTFVVNELFSIFKKLYANSPESMGPAFEQYFRNATMLVMEDPATGNTLLDISRVLADAKYREVKLSRSKNPVVNQFWREIATKAQGEASLANIVPYITNKFDIFTANEIMRPIIAQQTSAFRFREVMDSRKILLVNLSKGRLGDINANLLGMVLVGKILMAALSRVDALESDLPPFYLYIDEFQNITTDSISAILSEARKYKLSLNIAHQFIAQLDESIRDAVFGNVGSMAVFRVGAEDAKYLEPQLKPTFETQDIMNIENHNAYIRLLARGTPQKPFSIHVPPPRKGSSERAAHIKQLSQHTYGRAFADVDREVRMRYGIQ